MTSSNIIPFPPARNPSRARHLGSGAACQPAAASYSPIGNPAFDPVAFNEMLFQRELDAVREAIEMTGAAKHLGALMPDRATQREGGVRAVHFVSSFRFCLACQQD